MKLTSDEEKAIVAAHAKPNDVLASGLRIAGVKYFGISADGRTIQLKKGVRLIPCAIVVYGLILLLLDGRSDQCF